MGFEYYEKDDKYWYGDPKNHEKSREIKQDEYIRYLEYKGATQPMQDLEGPEPLDYQAMYESMADMYERLSGYNKEKFDEYWPESIAQGILAGKQYEAAMREGLGDINQFNRDTAFQYNWWLSDVTRLGNMFMREEAEKMNKWMMGQVGDVNAFNSQEFYKALEKAMPGIMGTAKDYKSTVDQMLSGELPDAVKREIAQAGAERGLSSGVYGPSLDNAQLRDLGIERLAYLQAGQAQMPALTEVAQALMAPVAAPNIYQNVMMTPTPYTPSPAMAQQVDYSGLGQNYLALLLGNTMLQPAQGLSSVGQMASIQSQQNIAATELQYAKAQSMLNLYMDQQTLAAQQKMFNKQMKVQQQGQWLQAGSSVLGGLLQASGASAGGIAGVFSL